jgi:NAD(P)-dependent dehydrogenase (short-subunit alcohol dehydrogenase family)
MGDQLHAIRGAAGTTTEANPTATTIPAPADAPVALVTGGANGIGAAVVRRLATAGATVVIADRDGSAAARLADIITADGRGRAHPAPLDVSDQDAVEAVVSSVVAEHGRLDAACNCAGVTGVRAELADYPEAVFRRVLAVNTGGTFACLQAELRPMARAGTGAIVNVASGAAALGVPGSAAYVAGKHAVAGLTRTAAIEYAARGIRVNAVAPGLVLTGAVVLDAERFAAAHPIGRPVSPEEVAEVTAWLLLEAPAALTGALIPVDGGLTAQVPGLS